MFIGKVVGFTKEYKSKSFNGVGYGIKVKPTENINVPKNTKKYFEVFPIGFNNACRNIGLSKKEIKKIFSRNSSVRVAAKLSDNTNSKNKLESLYTFPLSRNDLDPEFVSNGDSVFEYKNWKEKVAKNPPNSFHYLEFEVHKDLLRLHRAKTPDETLNILERLVYVPRINFTSVFLDILRTFKQKKYLENYNKRLQLIYTKRETISKEGFFNY